MVLGANLKPIKKDSTTFIYNQHNTEGNINPFAKYMLITADQNGLGYDEEVVRNTLKLNDNDQLEPPSSAEVFEKFLCKKLTTSMQRYTYMRLMDFAQFKNIFTSECDPEVFLLIVDIFQEQVINNEPFNNAQEQTFVADFIICLATQTPKFDFMLDFMDEKDHVKIKHLLNGLDKIEEDKKKEVVQHFDTI